jgi:hypothetical protein
MGLLDSVGFVGYHADDHHNLRLMPDMTGNFLS